MVRLATDPIVVRLAKDLGLKPGRDAAAAIRDHALDTVSAVIADLQVDSLDSLRRIVANKYRLKLETIDDDDDVERLAAQYADFHPHLRKTLTAEFINGRTEGITLERDPYDPALLRYLAVVDARGDRQVRAYFTGWHEITHLVVHPEQLKFPGFRRTTAELTEKDPLESLVDHVAGMLAFYPPLFQPALERVLQESGRLTFEAVERAKAEACPSASILATAMGSIRSLGSPALLVTVGMGLKVADRRQLLVGQQSLGFPEAEPKPDLRALSVIPNDHVPASGLVIRRNMRVPPRSVLAKAFEGHADTSLCEVEDQDWWETSADGPLPELDIRVESIRRGRYVYGLISPE